MLIFYSLLCIMTFLLYTSGRQKLFSNEEKVLLNKRVPDMEAATSVSNLCSE